MLTREPARHVKAETGTPNFVGDTGLENAFCQLRIKTSAIVRNGDLCLLAASIQVNRDVSTCRSGIQSILKQVHQDLPDLSRVAEYLNWTLSVEFNLDSPQFTHALV